MGSDMAMNPPQKKWEAHEVKSDEEVVEWLIGALAQDYEFNCYKTHLGTRIMRIFKGEWI